MIPKILHQVYGIFDDGKQIKDIPVFEVATHMTKSYAESSGYEYKLWNLKDCEELICEHYPEYIELWNEFRYPIQKADFIRYLILHRHGGFYLDCDVQPIAKCDLDDLLQNVYFFSCWNNDPKKKPYNAVFGAIPRCNLFIDICNDIVTRVEEKQSMKIYDSWKGRLVFQTTGHDMLKHHVQPCRIKDIMFIENKKKNISIKGEKPYFKDSNISSWY